MFNIVLFLTSCALMAGFAWYFCILGQSALAAWVAILSLLANLFVLKQIDLLGFNATASDIFAVGSLLGLNLLQEKYGKGAAQQAMWASFSCLMFFALFSLIHISYEPSIHDQSQEAYRFLLNPTPRIIISSLLTFLVVDQIDIRLYGYLRKKYCGYSALAISGISICLSQFLDTILFSFLGLYGIVQALTEIILVSYAIKLLAIANTIPWTFVSKRIFLK